MAHSPIVKCVANTCTHYIPGERCSAANIEILYEEESRMAENSEQTQCKTYQSRSNAASMLGSLGNMNFMGAITELFVPGIQLTPTVSCVVDSCQYWEQGNICTAEHIDVSGYNANEGQDTNCASYLPRY